MSTDHRRCDDLFTGAEEIIANGDWEQGATSFKEFHQAMEQHFHMEEEVLFPAFEQQTGQTMGPTQIMKMEHTQMRQLFSDMSDAVEQQNKDSYLGLAETLMMIIQQHNMKEEQMLYQMADQVLAPQVENVLQEMQDIKT
jgi:hemerythrin-like domain-containing protein